MSEAARIRFPKLVAFECRNNKAIPRTTLALNNEMLLPVTQYEKVLPSELWIVHQLRVIRDYHMTLFKFPSCSKIYQFQTRFLPFSFDFPFLSSAQQVDGRSGRTKV